VSAGNRPFPKQSVQEIRSVENAPDVEAAEAGSPALVHLLPVQQPAPGFTREDLASLFEPSNLGIDLLQYFWNWHDHLL
jgi:hypothetical protein